jgi:hypothetical protein
LSVLLFTQNDTVREVGRISLLLCVVAISLWIRGYWYCESWSLRNDDQTSDFHTTALFGVHHGPANSGMCWAWGKRGSEVSPNPWRYEYTREDNQNSMERLILATDHSWIHLGFGYGHTFQQGNLGAVSYTYGMRAAMFPDWLLTSALAAPPLLWVWNWRKRSVGERSGYVFHEATTFEPPQTDAQNAVQPARLRVQPVKVRPRGIDDLPA